MIDWIFEFHLAKVKYRRSVWNSCKQYIKQQRGFVVVVFLLLFIGQWKLCHEVTRALPLPNYHEKKYVVMDWGPFSTQTTWAGNANKFVFESLPHNQSDIHTYKKYLPTKRQQDYVHCSVLWSLCVLMVHCWERTCCFKTTKDTVQVVHT